MIGIDKLQEELIRSMNNEDFTFTEPGLDDVETFVRNYISANGYEVTVFHMVEITGARRYLRIWCKDNEFQRSYYIEIIVSDSPLNNYRDSIC